MPASPLPSTPAPPPPSTSAAGTPSMDDPIQMHTPTTGPAESPVKPLSPKANSPPSPPPTQTVPTPSLPTRLNHAGRSTSAPAPSSPPSASGIVRTAAPNSTAADAPLGLLPVRLLRKPPLRPRPCQRPILPRHTPLPTLLHRLPKSLTILDFNSPVANLLLDSATRSIPKGRNLIADARPNVATR